MSVRAAIVGGVAGAFVAGGISVAVAVPIISAASSPAPISACADKKTGVMRLATKAADCKSTEKYVSWNAQGPQGVPGAVGPSGAAGVTTVAVFASVSGSAERLGCMWRGDDQRLDF